MEARLCNVDVFFNEHLHFKKKNVAPILHFCIVWGE